MAREADTGPDSDESTSRTEGITVKVSSPEKRDAQMIAGLYNCDLGPMLRERSLNDILAEAARVKARHRKRVGAA